MTQAIHRYFDPLVAMNCRGSIGGSVLALILLGESALAFLRPFA